MTTNLPTRRSGVVLALVLAMLAATAGAAMAGASSSGPAPASFFYEDGEVAVFAGPRFDVEGGCEPAPDPDAHYVVTGAGTVHTQGRHDVEAVFVYDLADYGAETALDVLLAICFGGAPDEPILVGDGTVWLRNTNCDPGPNGCYEPGSSWTGKNWARGTVYDADGVAYDVRTFARIAVELPLDGPGEETILNERVDIR